MSQFFNHSLLLRCSVSLSILAIIYCIALVSGLSPDVFLALYDPLVNNTNSSSTKIQEMTSTVNRTLFVLVIFLALFSVMTIFVYTLINHYKYRLNELSMHDSLTGVYNRSYTMATAETVIALDNRQRQSAAVLLLNVDYLKSVNDEYGYDVGDLLLTQVVSSINDRVRESDVFGRYGSDEFLLVLPNISQVNAEHYARETLKTLSNNDLMLANSCVCYSASIGVAMSDGVAGIGLLVSRAKQALVSTKKAGRNGVTFYSEINGRATESPSPALSLHSQSPSPLFQ